MSEESWKNNDAAKLPLKTGNDIEIGNSAENKKIELNLQSQKASRSIQRNEKSAEDFEKIKKDLTNIGQGKTREKIFRVLLGLFVLAIVVMGVYFIVKEPAKKIMENFRNDSLEKEIPLLVDEEIYGVDVIGKREFLIKELNCTKSAMNITASLNGGDVDEFWFLVSYGNKNITLVDGTPMKENQTKIFKLYFEPSLSETPTRVDISGIYQNISYENIASKICELD